MISNHRLIIYVYFNQLLNLLQTFCWFARKNDSFESSKTSQSWAASLNISFLSFANISPENLIFLCLIYKGYSSSKQSKLESSQGRGCLILGKSFTNTSSKLYPRADYLNCYRIRVVAIMNCSSDKKWSRDRSPFLFLLSYFNS